MNHTDAPALVTASKNRMGGNGQEERFRRGLRVGGKRVVGWSRPRGARRGREKSRTGEKKGKITKRRLVHIFSVKTAAAESGCGETGEGKGRTMVIFRLIFYVSCERGTLPSLPTSLSLSFYSPFPSLSLLPSRPLAILSHNPLCPFSSLSSLLLTSLASGAGSIDYRR